MEKVKVFLNNNDNRRKVYMISAAFFPILVTMGFLNEDISSQILFLIAVILGVSGNTLAFSNTEKEKEKNERGVNNVSKEGDKK